MQQFENVLGITVAVLGFVFLIGMIYDMRKEFWEDVCSMAQASIPYALVAVGVFGGIIGGGFALVTVGGTVPSILGVGEWMPSVTIAGKIMVYCAPLTSLGGWTLMFWAERAHKRRVRSVSTT